MSGSLLSPLPSISTHLPPSSPLPGASRWSTIPLSTADERLPVGKIVLPQWPAPGWSVPLQAAPQRSLDPLPSTPIFHPFAQRVAVFEPVASPAPPAPPAPVEPPPQVTPEPAPAYFAPQPVVVASTPPPEPPLAIHEPTTPFVPVAEPVGAPPNHPAPPRPAPAPPPDYTDADLRDALAPLFKGLKTSPRDDERLEPMLRATIRRALAEYSPTGRPFEAPAPVDRFVWRMQALFSSRTYEDILFEKTHRFQVEEVFLVDAGSLALVSYASANPGRHASARRVENTVKRIAHQLRDAEGNIRPSFKLPDDRNVVVQQGSFITLFAIVRGQPNEIAVNDLSYALDSIEARFCERFRSPGSALLKALQPFLEDCLLIQSPAALA